MDLNLYSLVIYILLIKPLSNLYEDTFNHCKCDASTQSDDSEWDIID